MGRLVTLFRAKGWPVIWLKTGRRADRVDTAMHKLREDILLGGDNMDLALAHAVRERLVAAGTAVDEWQVRGLVHACRDAKEKLLGDAARFVGRSALGDGLQRRMLRTESDQVRERVKE